MNYKIIKITLLAFFGICILNACKKENSVIIEEEVLQLDNIITIVAEGNEAINKTYAAYCPSDTFNLYVIASREEYLAHPWGLEGHEANDFVLIIEENGLSSPSFRVALGEETTGLPGVQLSTFTQDLNVTWNVNNGIIDGELEGEFRGMDANSNWVYLPFTASFLAPIDPNLDCN